MDLLHLLRRLGDQLLRRELSSFEAVVSLDIFDVRILYVTAEKIKVFHFWFLLNDHGRLHFTLVLFFYDGFLAVKLCHFLNDSNEKAACVLVMRHHS